MNNKQLFNFQETEDTPAMIDCYVPDSAWHQALCFGLAVETDRWDRHKLLYALIGGADATIQSIKTTIDSGWNALKFGEGKKELTGYQFQKHFDMFSEKGAYTSFPMKVGSKKVIAIVHDDILVKGRYILSFEGNPANELLNVMQGSRYGLPIQDNWKEEIYKECWSRGYIKDVPYYYDKGLFPNGMSLFELAMEEEQADELVSDLIQTNRLEFPRSGTGNRLEEIDNLTDYMLEFNQSMVEKLSTKIVPEHDPLKDPTYEYFDSYNMELFPVQNHVSTAISKRLQHQKSVILQGEMSSGKSKMMTAIADGWAKMKGKTGFHSILMVPPSLTQKWATEEIYDLLPKGKSKVIFIKNTKELIDYHTRWIAEGRPKPTIPTFFVVSFTTMRNDCATKPVVDFSYKKTTKQVKEELPAYRYGYYCPKCGEAHEVVEDKRIVMNDNGEEEEVIEKRVMIEGEFGSGRRLHNSQKPANAFCSECGESLWTKKSPTRYSSFKEWTKHEKKLMHAIKQRNPDLARQVQLSQEDPPSKKGEPRRIAAIEYIRRKMKGFFDVAIVDEVHELKGGMTAQGNSLGSLASSVNKVIAGTGTLFGGAAEDVYYLLWRLFPYEMVKAGYKFSEVSKWNHEFGNIETTVYEQQDSSEYSNKQSRGGTKRTQKVKPGISAFVFGKFLLQNTVLVRLKDVWPDPVELVNVPTILVDMDEPIREAYKTMASSFESIINSHEKGYKLYLPYTETGISYPDNPYSYPTVKMKLDDDGERQTIWEPDHISADSYVSPKEAELQKLLTGEISEGRNSIVYVKDTGSTNADRDVRPRLKEICEQVEGAKVAILDSSTVATNKRSQWLRKKVEDEGHNVIICSAELVKVGLDLLCTPTLIFYQFSWSLYTINQASKRAWRIGQTEECRLYYLAYRDTFQEYMANIIAQKNKAAQAMNGEASSDGINAMLGADSEDLQAMLIRSIKEGGKGLKGSTEEWTAQTSDRARELLANIGKKKKKAPTQKDQLVSWAKGFFESKPTYNVLVKESERIVNRIASGKVNGFTFNNGVLEVDMIQAFGFDFAFDGQVIKHLIEEPRKSDFVMPEIKVVQSNDSKGKKKSKVSDGQLGFDLFA